MRMLIGILGLMALGARPIAAQASGIHGSE